MLHRILRLRSLPHNFVPTSVMIVSEFWFCVYHSSVLLYEKTISDITYTSGKCFCIFEHRISEDACTVFIQPYMKSCDQVRMSNSSTFIFKWSDNCIFSSNSSGEAASFPTLNLCFKLCLRLSNIQHST